MLQRLKERKAKIRKFMLYVNGMLNDTEKDMQMLCQHFMDISESVSEPVQKSKLVSRLHPKSKRHLKHIKRTASHRNEEEVVVPETDPSSLKDMPDTQLKTVVPETCAAQSYVQSELCSVDSIKGTEATTVESKEQIHHDGSVNECSIEDDETIGIHLDQSFPSYAVITSNCSKQVDNANTCREISGSKGKLKSAAITIEPPINSPNLSDPDEETYFLSPVTNLVNDVLGAAKPSHGTDNAKSVGVESTYLSRFNHQMLHKSPSHKIPLENVTGHRSPPKSDKKNLERKCNAVDLTASPALFADSEDNGELEGREDQLAGACRKTIAVNPSSSDHTDRTAKKTVTCWPIGYPKPAPRGELVVEPATKGRSRRKPRQTRLDGFLAKAAFYSSMESSSNEPLIVMKATGSAHSSISEPVKVDASSSSESDDVCDIDVAVLRIPNTADKSKEKTEREEILEDKSAEFDMVPKKAKYEIGQVVRGKARKHLTGYRCKQCYEYYSTLDLSEDQIQRRLNMVCRHRAVKPPMETPPNFWNMSIASLDSPKK
ncbi:uncharacterized protein [Watersipora subatra]|uniref:uncharacterized protein n=1 Tax=Watersipora subatra TaxID=2589382 RepID=UPI00355B7FC2